jgi:hypothetical protein
VALVDVQPCLRGRVWVEPVMNGKATVTICRPCDYIQYGAKRNVYLGV